MKPILNNTWKYLFYSRYLVITWWRKGWKTSWDFIPSSGILSLGRLFIEWDRKGNL